jgi:hypothetical protein
MGLKIRCEFVKAIEKDISKSRRKEFEDYKRWLRDVSKGKNERD